MLTQRHKLMQPFKRRTKQTRKHFLLCLLFIYSFQIQLILVSVPQDFTTKPLTLNTIKHKLFTCVSQLQDPLEWNILPIYKDKGSPKECSNYRGISLLSTPSNVFATVLLNKVCDQFLSQRRKAQSGFTPGRSTVHCPTEERI